ncbi:MAG TPA: aquaporin [Phycisphaerales bacterium]|nr:aquaporin [Phycisphaerales bacterium]
MNKLLAEGFGAFCLTLAGTAAITAGVDHVGICLTFGLVVMVMIYAIGDVSGAHMNPAVTLGFVLARRMPGGQAVGYIVAQVLGALLASIIVRAWYQGHPTIGANVAVGDGSLIWRPLIAEVVLTFILMFVILCVSTGPKEKGITAAIAVGGTIALDALFGGPISGASMNPARSIGPGVIATIWPAKNQLAEVAGVTLRTPLESLWVYLLGPIAGAALAVPFFKAVTGTTTAPASEFSR